MKSNRITRLLLPLVVLAALALTAGSAHAQCAITGPAEVCGSPVSLCGPDGSEFYMWTFPDGSVEYAQCITASAAGSYELRYIDPFTHDWAAPCTHVLASGSAAPVITGASSACAGEPIELCGPAGNFEYQWTGPSGFASSAACIAAAEAGTFELRVRPLPDGCWSGVSAHSVNFTDCTPAAQAVSCPRPVWWWARQCPDHDHSGQRLDPSLLASISACVTEHEDALEGSLCDALRAHPRTLEVRARRQVAAVWANVCAGEEGILAGDGRAVSLDPAADVNVAGYHGTVSAWLESASGVMQQHSGGGNRRESRDALRRVIRVAWHINRGIGIGEVCARPGDDLLAGKHPGGVLGASSLSEEFDPEPLAAELVEDSDALLAFGEILPNPFATRMTLGYAITAPTTSDVVIGVYDISGRLVRELVRGAHTPGQYVARWDGRDESGSSARGGMYFVLGRIDGSTVQSRVTLVR
jgi:hypothetical protein